MATTKKALKALDDDALYNQAVEAGWQGDQEDSDRDQMVNFIYDAAKPSKPTGTLVYTLNSIWLENSQARPEKVPAGMLVYLTDDELKHFRGRVTRDRDDEKVAVYDRS